MDHEIGGEASELGSINLRTLLDVTGREAVELCNSEATVVDQAFAEAVELNPSVQWDAFLENFDYGYDDTDCDVSLDQIIFAVFQRGREKAIGSWILYNVRTLLSTLGTREVTAYPAPGLPYRGVERQWERSMVKILEYFLENALPVSDGSTFQVVGWEFPSDRSGHHWGRASNILNVLKTLRVRGKIEEVRRLADGAMTMKRLRLVRP